MSWHDLMDMSGLREVWFFSWTQEHLVYLRRWHLGDSVLCFSFHRTCSSETGAFKLENQAPKK